MIVEFKRNGKRARMNPKIARFLATKGKLKIVGDEAVTPAAQPEPAAQIAPVTAGAIAPEVATGEHAETEAPAASDGLDEMSREQLLKFAEDLGIKIHARSGDEKIREIIREHTK